MHLLTNIDVNDLDQAVVFYCQNLEQYMGDHFGRNFCMIQFLSRGYCETPISPSVIDRFGHFPHRNVILGRESTPEEKAFLAQWHSLF